MALTDKKRDKLIELLARETSKAVHVQHTPAVFRETALDTHPKLPAEYYGPASVSPEEHTAKSLTYLRSNQALKLAKAGRRSSKTQTPECLTAAQQEFKSVFKPSPGQQAVCALSKERRKHVANSEWALLDTWQVNMFVEERDQRQLAAKAVEQEQKAYLDTQMQQLEVKKKQEEQQKQVEKLIVQQAVGQYEQEEQRKAEAARQHNMKIKLERKQMLEESRAVQAANIAKTKEAEKKLLADIQLELEKERKLAVEKQEAAKKQVEATKIENAKRLEDKRLAEAAQKQKDEELMAETLRTLEKQEKEREAKIQSFYATIAARANKAGQKVVEENNARAEREARLIAQFEEQKEKEYQEREAKEKAKAERMKAELRQAREEYTAVKAAKIAAEKAEVAQLAKQIEEKARLEKEKEDKKMAAIRERTITTKQEVKLQMDVREHAAVSSDIYMSEAERKINAKLVGKAKEAVGAPKQLTVKLC